MNLNHARAFFIQNLRDQLIDTRRVIAPIFFGILITIIFAFSVDLSVLDASTFASICAGQLTTILIFVMQVILQQSMDSESNDGVFEQLRVQATSAYLWFVVKTLTLSFCTILLLTPVLLLWCTAHQLSFGELFGPSVVSSLVIATLGLSALGILLAAITMTSSGRSLIYAILFFVLSCPVLLSLVPIFKSALSAKALTESIQLSSHIVMLGSFSLIFMSLGCVLFHEIVRGDS